MLRKKKKVDEKLPGEPEQDKRGHFDFLPPCSSLSCTLYNCFAVTTDYLSLIWGAAINVSKNSNSLGAFFIDLAIEDNALFTPDSAYIYNRCVVDFPPLLLLTNPSFPIILVVRLSADGHLFQVQVRASKCIDQGISSSIFPFFQPV